MKTMDILKIVGIWTTLGACILGFIYIQSVITRFQFKMLEEIKLELGKLQEDSDKVRIELDKKTTQPLIVRPEVKVIVPSAPTPIPREKSFVDKLFDKE